MDRSGSGLGKAKWAGVAQSHHLSPAFARALDAAIGQSTPEFPFPLTARPDPIDGRDFMYRPSLVELPTYKLPFVRPGTRSADVLAVRNQRAEGSCTGQALAAVIDIQNIKRLAQGADVPGRVSARMLYAAAQAFDEFADDDLPGSSIRGVIKGFWNRGACSDEAMPYVPGWRNDSLTVAIAHDARRVSLGTYMRLRHILNDYHCALVEADVLLVSAMIHEGWTPEAVKRNKGVIEMRDVPRPRGAHAFAVIGFTPDGFLVLNSWGGAWGGFDPYKDLQQRLDRVGILGAAASSIDAIHAGAGSLPGVALWRYADWQRHVLDAWVIRLAAPTHLPAGESGGYIIAGPASSAARANAAQSRSVRESDVLGHIVHFSEADLVSRGLYATPLATIQETARFLSQDPASAKYAHVAIFAPAAFETRAAILDRARCMIPVFKRNGVYPLFLVFRSNFGEVVGDVIRPLMPSVLERTGGGVPGVADIMLERMTSPVGSVLWSNFKRDAARAFASGSAVRHAVATLLTTVTAQGEVRRRGLHLIGASGGALVLGELAAALRAEAAEADIRSVSLLAPACSIAFLEERLVLPQPCTTTVYTLAADDEQKPDPDLGGYGKSALWLVSRAFEEAPGVPLAGIHAHHSGRTSSAQLISASATSPDCRATWHRGFGADTYTMNHVLRRIVGRPRLNDGNGGFRLAEIGAAGGW